MELPTEYRLLLLILAAFVIGIAVLLVNPDYRIQTIQSSNAQYFSEIESGSAQDDVETEDPLHSIEF
ncbi:hypothetical protein JW979_10800 [bacterium]|nr:hypothetical protein [candidate division CSSED10-310 bacterium]